MADFGGFEIEDDEKKLSSPSAFGGFEIEDGDEGASGEKTPVASAEASTPKSPAPTVASPASEAPVSTWESGDGGAATLPEGETNQWGGNLRNEGRKPLIRRDANGKVNGYSTTTSMLVRHDDGKFAVVPTVVDGEELSLEDAVRHYAETGEYWGVADDEEGAKKIARAVHDEHQKSYQKGWNDYIHDHWDDMGDEIRNDPGVRGEHSKRRREARVKEAGVDKAAQMASKKKEQVLIGQSVAGPVYGEKEIQPATVQVAPDLFLTGDVLDDSEGRTVKPGQFVTLSRKDGTSQLLSFEGASEDGKPVFKEVKGVATAGADLAGEINISEDDYNRMFDAGNAKVDRPFWEQVRHDALANTGDAYRYTDDARGTFNAFYDYLMPFLGGSAKKENEERTRILSDIREGRLDGYDGKDEAEKLRDAARKAKLEPWNPLESLHPGESDEDFAQRIRQEAEGELKLGAAAKGRAEQARQQTEATVGDKILKGGVESGAFALQFAIPGSIMFKGLSSMGLGVKAVRALTMLGSAIPATIAEADKRYSENITPEYGWKQTSLDGEPEFGMVAAPDAPSEAAYKAIGGAVFDTAVEVGLELVTMGLLRLAGKPAGWLLGKATPGAVKEWGAKKFNRFMASETGQALRQINRAYQDFAGMTQINSPFGELAEENVQALEKVLNLDGKTSEYKGLQKEWNDFYDRQFNADTQWDIFYGLIVQLGLGAAKSTAEGVARHMSEADVRRNVRMALARSGISEATLKTLTPEQQKKLDDMWRQYSADPDALKENVKDLGISMRLAVDELTAREGLKMRQTLEQRGIAPERFTIQTGADGKPAFQKMTRLTPDGKKVPMNAMTDAAHGVTIVDQGDGNFYVMNDFRGLDAIPANSFEDAQRKADAEVVRNQSMDADNEQKTQYLMGLVQRQYAGRNVVSIPSEAALRWQVAQAVHDGRPLFGITRADQLFREDGSLRQPGAGGFHTPDGHIVVILDNVPSPAEMERVLAHEATGHEGVESATGRGAKTVEFIQNAQAEGFSRFVEGERQRRIAANMEAGMDEESAVAEAEAHMATDDYKRESMARYAQGRLHAPTWYERRKHEANERRRRAGENVPTDQADLEVMLAEQEARGREGANELETLNADSGVRYEEGAEDETGNGATEAPAQPEQGEERGQEAPRPEAGAEPGAQAPDAGVVRPKTRRGQNLRGYSYEDYAAHPDDGGAGDQMGAELLRFARDNGGLLKIPPKGTADPLADWIAGFMDGNARKNRRGDFIALFGMKPRTGTNDALAENMPPDLQAYVGNMIERDGPGAVADWFLETRRKYREWAQGRRDAAREERMVAKDRAEEGEALESFDFDELAAARDAMDEEFANALGVVEGADEADYAALAPASLQVAKSGDTIRFDHDRKSFVFGSFDAGSGVLVVYDEDVAGMEGGKFRRAYRVTENSIEEIDDGQGNEVRADADRAGDEKGPAGGGGEAQGGGFQLESVTAEQITAEKERQKQREEIKKRQEAPLKGSGAVNVQSEMDLGQTGQQDLFSPIAEKPVAEADGDSFDLLKAIGNPNYITEWNGRHGVKESTDAEIRAGLRKQIVDAAQSTYDKYRNSVLKNSDAVGDGEFLRVVRDAENVEDFVKGVKDLIEKHRAVRDDWAGRSYKTSKKKVDVADRSDAFTIAEGETNRLSTDYINERRRRNRVESEEREMQGLREALEKALGKQTLEDLETKYLQEKPTPSDNRMARAKEKAAERPAEYLAWLEKYKMKDTDRRFAEWQRKQSAQKPAKTAPASSPSAEGTITPPKGADAPQGGKSASVATDRTGVPDWIDDEGIADIYNAPNWIEGWHAVSSAFFRHSVRTDGKLDELRKQFAEETSEAKRKKLNNQYKKRIDELWAHLGEVQPQDEMRDAVNAIQSREGAISKMKPSQIKAIAKADNLQSVESTSGGTPAKPSSRPQAYLDWLNKWRMKDTDRHFAEWQKKQGAKTVAAEPAEKPPVSAPKKEGKTTPPKGAKPTEAKKTGTAAEKPAAPKSSAPKPSFKRGDKVFLKGAAENQRVTFLKANADGTADVQVRTPGANRYAPEKVETRTVPMGDVSSTGMKDTLTDAERNAYRRGMAEQTREAMRSDPDLQRIDAAYRAAKTDAERNALKAQFAERVRALQGGVNFDTRELAGPSGRQKQAGVAYPDASEEIRAQVSFDTPELGKKSREDFGRILTKHRPDLDANAVIDEIAKFDTPKKRKAALHWVVRGAIRLPEDAYKVEDALSVAEKAKVDPFAYSSPLALIEAHKDIKPMRRAIDPATVPELSDPRDEGDGIVSYEVSDTREGQAAMRRIIDTHWGEDANPWCLLARGNDASPEVMRAAANFYPGDPDAQMAYIERQKKRDDGLARAWDYWNHYNALPKRVAFKDGKLLAFMATENLPQFNQFDGGEEEAIWFEEQYERYESETGLSPWKIKGQITTDAFNQWLDAQLKGAGGPEQWWDRQDESHPDLDWARGNAQVNFDTPELSPVTPAEDAAYMDAVRRGDMDTAQRMVREAAARAMPDAIEVKLGYGEERPAKMLAHEVRSMPKELAAEIGKWDIVSKSPYSDSFYNSNDISWDGKPDGSLRISNHWNFKSSMDDGKTHCKTNVPVENEKTWALGRWNAEKDEYEILKVLPAVGEWTGPSRSVRLFLGGRERTGGMKADETATTKMARQALSVANGGKVPFVNHPDVLLDATTGQIKTLDAVTRDDAGNVIPLSQRFNQQNDDIRFDTPELSAPEMSRIAKKYGTTDEYVRGWILPDGRNVDLNPTAEGAWQDHDEIRGLLDKRRGVGGSSVTLDANGREEAMCAGAIRYHNLGDEAIIDVWRKPSARQINALYDYVEKGEFDPGAKVTLSFSPGEYITYDSVDEMRKRLVNDIRRHYSGVNFDTPELTPAEAEYAAGEDKTPTEKVMREVYGMTNDEIATALKAAGMEPPAHVRKTDADMWRQVETLLSNSTYMAKLSRAVAKFPRPTRDYENVALNVLFRQRQAAVNDLERRRAELAAIPEDDMNKTPELRDELKQVSAKLAQAKAQMAEAGKAAMTGASEQGRALRSNRALIDAHDYSYAGIAGRIAQTLGGIDKITPEMNARIRDLAKLFEGLDEEGLRLATERLIPLSKKVIDQTKNGLKVRKATERKVGDVARKIAQNYQDALMQIEVGAVETGGTLVGLSDQQYPSWGKWLRQIGEYHCFLNPEITEEEVIDAIVRDISPFMEGVDANQVRDALTGFGHNYKMSRYDAQRLMNDLKAQARLKRQLDWMDETNTMPPLTGIVRDEPSDTTRNLQKQVAERKKEVPDAGRDERRLKGILDSAKKRVQNRIADLERAIATGERIPAAQRKVMEDIELRELKKRKDELQKAYDELFGTERTMTDTQRIAATEKALARMLEQTMEDFARAQSGDFSKRPQRPGVTSETIETLRDRIRQVRESIRELKNAKYAFGMTPEEIEALNARKITNREKAVARLAERVATGDFRTGKPQPPMTKDQQKRYDDLGEQMKRGRQKLAELRLEAENATVPTFVRKGVNFLRFVTTAQRALRATMDFSAVLRQAARMTLGHPVKAAQAFGKAWTAMRSEASLLDVNTEILSDPTVQEAVRKFGLHLREVDAQSDRDVEMFHGMERNKVKIFGKEYAITDIPLFGKFMLKSERHYLTYLNAMSADLYTSIVNGIPGGATPWQKKMIADMINIWNGSAALSKERRQALQKAWVNDIFWAPQLAISRVQSAVGYDWWHPLVAKGIKNADGTFEKVSNEERKTAAKVGLSEHMRSTIAMLAIGALLKWLFSDDDDKYNFSQADWFEKMMMLVSPKVGNTTIDLTGGESTFNRLVHQLATKSKRSGTGRLMKFGDFNGPTTMGTIGRYLQGKLSPSASTIVALWEGKDYVGEEYGVGKMVREMLIPLTFEDVKDQLEQNGVGKSLVTVPLSILGAGGSTYDRKPYENAVNRFLEAKKEYDAIQSDDSVSGDERNRLLSGIRDANPLMRDDVRGKISAYIKGLRTMESTQKKAQKAGRPTDELDARIERRKAEILDMIRAARK